MEAEEIAAAREAAHREVRLVEPYYEAGGVARLEPEDNVVREDLFKSDYLAPFLPHRQEKALTREQALCVKEACLKVRVRG